jgi:hypothetical protein
MWCENIENCNTTKTPRNWNNTWNSESYKNIKWENTLAEKKEQEQEWDVDNILLALNDDYESAYRKMQEQQKEIRKEMKYCIETWIIKEFQYPFYNEDTQNEDSIHFKICGDMKTVEFWHHWEWKIWVMKLINMESETWEIECNTTIQGSKKCFQTLWECVKESIKLCMK